MSNNEELEFELSDPYVDPNTESGDETHIGGEETPEHEGSIAEHNPIEGCGEPATATNLKRKRSSSLEDDVEGHHHNNNRTS